MKHFISSVTLVLSALALPVVAQQVLRSDHIVDRNIGGQIVAREFQPRPETVESVFLDEAWTPGTIIFSSNDSLAGLPTRIDLKNNVIEIRHNETIKILPISKCKKLILQGRTFVNADNDKSLKGIAGLVEILVSGNVSFCSKYSLDVYKANYNAAMDVGSRNDRYVVKEQLFLIKDGSPIDISKAGKKILDQFDGHKTEVESFVKDNDLSYRKKEDLVKVVTFYNSRVK